MENKSLNINDESSKKRTKLTVHKVAKGVKGITLIALVVTIIVLLILAGVAINLTIGDNGIFSRTEESREITEKASEQEKLQLALMGLQIGENGYQELNQSNIQKILDSEFENKNKTVIDNGNGNFTINLDNKLYKVENSQVSEIKVDLYINNLEDLEKFRDEVNNGDTFEGKYVVLTSDISLNVNEEWEPIGKYPPTNTSPDDESNRPFKRYI